MKEITYNDISDSSKQQYMGLTAWFVCLSAALFFSYELIQMHMFSAINEDLMREFSLNAQQLGYLSSVYLWANVIFLFPAGWILDRVSTKRLILISMGICVLGTFLFAFVSNYWTAFVSRFFTGIGSAFCLLSCVRLASRWFPTHRLALVTGLVVTIAMLGGVFAQTPLTELTKAIGWRRALCVDGLIGILIMGLISAVVRDYPTHRSKEQIQQKNELSALGLLTSLRQAYFRIQNWLAAIYTSTMNMPIILLGAIWGTLYLNQAFHLSKVQASLINSLIFVGTIVGGPFVGWISDKIGYRRIPMMIGSLLSLATILLLLQSDSWEVSTLALLFFALGLFSSTQVIGYPVVSESNSPLITASSVSIVSIVTQGGGAFYQPLFGTILQKNWNGVYVDQVPLYSVHNYHLALWIIVFGFIVAFIAAFFVKETYCKQIK